MKSITRHAMAKRTLEKMLVLSGKPNKLTRKSREDIPFVIDDCRDYRAFYWDTVDERMGYLKKSRWQTRHKIFRQYSPRRQHQQITLEIRRAPKSERRFMGI